MKTRFFCIAFCLMFLGQMTQASTFTYHWEIDETPSGQESVSLPEPIEVEIEGSGIRASLSNGAATKLASKYKVFLSPQWDSEKAYLLLKTIWNGRNEWGESVASGVYFYTLKTGDFTATRKLLIRK